MSTQSFQSGSDATIYFWGERQWKRIVTMKLKLTNSDQQGAEKQ
jgi:hypothetical protein